MRHAMAWPRATRRTSKPCRESRAATSRTARRQTRSAHLPAAPATWPGASAGRSSLVLGHDVALSDDPQHVEPPPVRTQHFELQPAEHERLATPRQAAEIVHREPADGVELLVAELAAEILVELLDARLRLDRELALAFLADVEVVLDVVLIADVADDLLQHVFDGHQSGHAAILVDDYCHVMMAGAEFLEQHVEALALRNEHDRPQALLDIEV